MESNNFFSVFCSSFRALKIGVVQYHEAYCILVSPVDLCHDYSDLSEKEEYLSKTDSMGWLSAGPLCKIQ